MVWFVGTMLGAALTFPILVYIKAGAPRPPVRKSDKTAKSPHPRRGRGKGDHWPWA